MSNNKTVTRSTKSAKSVSEDGSDQQISLQQILNKLEEIEKSSNKQYQSLLTAVNKINSRLDALESEQTRVIDCLDFISNDVDELKKEHEQLKVAVSKLENANNTRSAQDNALTNTVDRIEHEKNLKTLIVANIPASHHKDTVKLVTNLAAKLDASILTGDIDSAFCIKSQTSTYRPPLIMVKFTNTVSRDNLFNARKNFKKHIITTQSVGFWETDKIYMNEALTRSQRSLFYKARQTKSQTKWRYVWTYHGQVFMRKTVNDDPVKIASEKELDQLMASTTNSNA